MKANVFSATIAAAGAIIASTHTHAAYLGLTAQLHTTINIGGPGGGLKDVYRYYAVFNNPDDHLVAVFGSAASPLTVNLLGGTPYNPSIGGNVPQNAEVVAAYPHAQWDSYVTIGLTAGYEGDPGAGLVLSPFFPNFITSDGIQGNTNIAWTTPGPQPQGKAGNGLSIGIFGDAYGVLFMQITVAAGDQSPFGNFGLTYTPAGGNSINLLNQTIWIPAPSALAMLVIAGFTRTPRRRRE